MKLHKIMLRHAGPKSVVEVVKCYVLANNEKQILQKLASRNEDYTHGIWLDRDEEDGFINVYDDSHKIIATDTYLEHMLRVRGEFNYKDASLDDAYYGIHHYGWSEGQDVSADEIHMLKKLGIVEDWSEIEIS